MPNALHVVRRRYEREREDMKTFAVLALVAFAGAAQAQTFFGSGAAIPDNTVGGVNGGNIVVAGPLGTIQSVSFGMQGLTHTWVGDLIATVTYTPNTGAPISVNLMNRIGLPPAGAGDSSDFGGDYTFSDSGADLWAAAAAAGGAIVIAGGDYRATGAGSSSPINLTALFAGADATGTWSLNVADRAGADVGAFTGWSVSLTAVPAPSALAMMGLGGLVAGRRRR